MTSIQKTPFTAFAWLKLSTDHTCPSLSVTGISFCCSLFLTLPQLCRSWAVLATHRLQPLQVSLIHSPVTAIAQMLSHGSSSGSSGCSRAPWTPPFGSALAHGGSAVAGTGHPQPSPTEPLQSPCYQAWEFVPIHLDKKHLQAPGWLLGCPHGWEWSAECG